MKLSKDPLLAATTSLLWPVLKLHGFRKLAPRKFIRTVGVIAHRVTLDANGFGGKASTHLVYDVAQLCRPDLGGYVLGGRLDGGPWDMSTYEAAIASMQFVVARIEGSLMPWFSNVSTLQDLGLALQSLKTVPGEPVHFERAVNFAALGDLPAAKAEAERAIAGTLPYWRGVDSPARELLASIEADNHEQLLARWASAYGACYGDA